MKLLVDTQIIFWIAQDSKELGKAARRVIQSSKETYFSPVSVFELNIKHSNNRLKLPSNFLELLSINGFQELSLKAEYASDVSRFPSLNKHDPFDRMIMAQAAANHLSLLTSDQKLLDLGFDWIIDARD